jgi:spore maturation protein CgeB
MSGKLKILVIEWKAEPLMAGLSAGMVTLGHDIRRLSISPDSEWESLLALLEEPADLWITHCSYIFDFWKYRDRLRDLVERKNQQVALWYWENPFASGTHAWLDQFLSRSLPKTFHFFVVDPTHQKLFQGLGYTASYLPLGALDEWFRFEASSDQQLRWAEELVFVGTPIRQIHFQIQNESECVDAFCRLFVAEFFSFLAEQRKMMTSEKDFQVHGRAMVNALSAFMKGDYSDPFSFDRARATIEQSLKLVVPPEMGQHLLNMRGRLEILYSWRQLVTRLDDVLDLGLRVYGGEEWTQSLLPRLSKASPRLTDEELAASFQSATIQICYTKWCFPHAMHERPLKILAHGGFALTDRPQVVNEFFPDGGLETYASRTELRDKIQFYSRAPEARREMILRGKRFLYEYHRMQHRAESMLKSLNMF